jgi:hypothetical protein
MKTYTRETPHQNVHRQGKDSKSMSGGMTFNMGAKKGNMGPKIAFGLKTQQKTPRPAAFAPATDSDDEVPDQDQKRQRRSFTGLGSL